MNKKKIKDTRRASAFMFLFSAKEHYIDKLYRAGLSDFTIPPVGGAELFPAALEQYVASTALESAVSVVSQTAFWNSKLSYIVACCGTAAITGTACWLAMSENSPLKSDSDMLKNDYEMVTVSDTTTYSLNPIDETFSIFDADIFNDRDTARSLSPAMSAVEREFEVRNVSTDTPIVVTKQIIQRQTVVVRDTVYIIE